MSHATLNTSENPYLPDPYLPKSGSPDYRVHHYDLELDCKLANNRLVGRARIDAVADAALNRVELDLCGLTVRKVQVDGKKAARFSQREDKLIITPAAPLAAGRGFRLDIRYDGTPRPRVGHFGEVGWEELTDGVLVANQPDGAATWFPCNDHPSQKATYRISVATDAGYRAVCNGSLEDHTRRASREEWVYRVGEPMATYLATVQIGRYGMSAIPTGVEAGASPPGAGRHRPADTTVSQWLATGPAQEVAALRALEEQPRMLEVFIDAFGAYPFADYGVVVTNDDLEIPLEAHGLSILGRNHLVPGWEHQRLIAHELAHQWFGNSLTVGSWDEIWLHEGFACYAEWIWSEASGADSAHEQARAAWAMLARLPQDVTVGAPGAANMFDDRVYKRGALALHMLRLHLGESLFFSMLRAWTQTMGHGTVTYALFCGHVDAHAPAGFSTRDVLAPWLFKAVLPAFPKVTAP